MPVSDYIQLNAFLDYLQFEKRYSRHTIIAYQGDLEQFYQYLGNQFDSPALEQITAGMVKSWLATIKEYDDLAAKSINRKISALKSFFKYQMRLGLLDKSPMLMVVSPKAKKRLPVFVAEKDMVTLFASVEFPDNWNGRTERLVLLLFYQTGMRLSELIQLKVGQLDPSSKQVKVLGKGNKERIIPVEGGILTEIASYIQDRNLVFPGTNFVFTTAKGRPLQPRTVYAFVKKWLTLVTTVQKKSPHILRHSFATHLMNHGADLNAVKELLGHSSLAATQVYTHNSIEKLKEVFNKAHPKA
jgi:integrase/recombinase XerC